MERAPLDGCYYEFNCAVHNRRLYVVVRSKLQDSILHIERYDPQKNKWSSLKSMMVSRDKHGI